MRLILVKVTICTWMKLLGKEFDRVHGTTTPVKAEQGSDKVVQAMLTQMQKQTDVIQLAMQSNIDKNKGPRPPTPSAPSFCPLNDLHDCKRWREFIENFTYFTSGIPLKRTKLLHLRSCLKGRAQVDIQHLTLTEENYDLALQLLEKEYADP